MLRDGSSPCAAAKARASPGNGGRHQHRGGPPPCGQTALSSGPLDDVAQAGDGAVERLRRPVRVPVEHQVRRGRVGVGDRRLPAGPFQRGRRDQHARAPKRCGALPRHLLDAGKPLVQRWRLELAQRAHLRRRRHHPLVGARQRPQLLGRRHRSEQLDQPSHQVDLRLGERSVQPHAADRRSVPGGGLEDVATGRARQVGVVEHHPRRAGGQGLLERLRHVAQRAAAFVAVEPVIAAADVLTSLPGLAGSRYPHHHDHLHIALPDGARMTRGGRRSIARSSPVSASLAARAALRAVSGRRAPGMATTVGDRDNSHASATSAASAPRRAAICASASSPLQGPHPAHTPQGRVRDQRDAQLGAPLQEPSAQGGVVMHAERDLHGADGGKFEGLVELAAIDVGHPYPGHEVVIDESGQRAHRRRPWRAWIGRMQQVGIDGQSVEGDEARLAVGADRAWRGRRAPTRRPRGSSLPW